MSIKANVFQMGKLMHILICRSRTFEGDTLTSIFVTELADQKLALVYGRDLLDAPYSFALGNLLLSSLAAEPANRPDAKTLLNDVRRGLAACAAAPDAESFRDMFKNLNPDIDDDYSI